MSLESIKIQNRNGIYNYILNQGFATKNDIVSSLNLSLPTVNHNIDSFLKEGLISEGKKINVKNKSGRNPIAYTYVPNARYSIGIDITTNHIKCLLLDLNDEIIKYEYKRKKYERTDDYLQYLGICVDEITANIDKKKILGVGIAVPGLINAKTQKVVFGKVIDNNDMSVTDFSKYIPYTAKLIHDSNAAGFAEFWFEKKLKNTFYISLCNSVGGSALIHGRIYTGDGNYSAEIGHLKIGNEQRVCYCGQKDCLDTYCNAMVLSQHTNYSLDDFFAQLKTGDESIQKIWDNYLDYLAIGIHNVRVLYGCVIILGGDVGAFLGDWMDILYKKVDLLSFIKEDSKNYLYQCGYKKESVATGAALYYIQKFKSNPTANKLL